MEMIDTSMFSNLYKCEKCGAPLILTPDGEEWSMKEGKWVHACEKTNPLLPFLIAQEISSKITESLLK